MNTSVEQIPEPTLVAVERHLHVMMRGSRAARFIDKHALPLPSLAAMLAGEASELFEPTGEPGVWFYRVPGMYGGFRLQWLVGGEAALLESLSFCRVAGGSARRHQITATGCELVESGMF